MNGQFENGNDNDYLIHEIKYLKSCFQPIIQSLEDERSIACLEKYVTSIVVDAEPYLKERYQTIISNTSYFHNNLLLFIQIFQPITTFFDNQRINRNFQVSTFTSKYDEIEKQIDSIRNNLNPLDNIFRTAMNNSGNLFKISEDISNFRINEESGKNKLKLELSIYQTSMQKFNEYRYKMEAMELKDKQYVESFCHQEKDLFHLYKRDVGKMFKELNARIHKVGQNLSDIRTVNTSDDGFDTDFREFCKNNEIAIRDFALPTFRKIYIKHLLKKFFPIQDIGFVVDIYPEALAKTTEDCTSLDGQTIYKKDTILMVFGSFEKEEILVSDTEYCLKKYVSAKSLNIYRTGICFYKDESLFGTILGENNGNYEILLTDGQTVDANDTQIYKL